MGNLKPSEIKELILLTNMRLDTAHECMDHFKDDNDKEKIMYRKEIKRLNRIQRKLNEQK